MISQQLLDYIKSQLQNGVEAEKIKEALRQSGWEEKDIQEGFQMVGLSQNDPESINNQKNQYKKVSANQIDKPKGTVILNKKLLWIFVISLVIIVGMAFMFGLKNTSKTKPIQTSTTTSSTNIFNTPNHTSNSTLAPKKKSQVKKSQVPDPKKSWLKMKKECDKIKSYNDLLNYFLKYGSKKQITKYMAKKKQMDALPLSFRNNLAMLAKKPLSNEITNIREIINGNTATLYVQTDKPGSNGVVNLILKNNQWKIDSETWHWNK